MARPLRIEYSGAWYHFTCRGNERNKIYQDDQDREKFLTILGESLEKYRVELHGYVLMTNHFHLLLHTPVGNLSRFAQRFNTAYTVYYNRRHKRSGHLYQGRYKAIVVESDNYLLALSRYIHLNPIKIKQVKKLKISEQIDFLKKYSWSSNLGYGLLRQRKEFVCYSNVLGYLGGDNKGGRRGYREYIEEGLLRDITSPFDDVKGQIVLAESGFIEWLYEKVMKRSKPDKIEQRKSNELVDEISLEVIIETVCKIFDVKRRDILKRRSLSREVRMVCIDLCCKYGVYHKSLGEIGRELGGLTVGGMGQARRRLNEKLQVNKELKSKYNNCIKLVNNE